MKQIHLIIIAALIAVAVAGYAGYQSGYSKGYDVAKTEADKAVQEIRDILARKEAEEKEAKARELDLLKKQEEHGKKYIGNW